MAETMAKKKKAPKPKEDKPKQADYFITVDLSYTDILTFVSGDARMAEFRADDGKLIRVAFRPVDGGVPVDVKLIDLLAERYEKLAKAMKQSLTKVDSKE